MNPNPDPNIVTLQAALAHLRTLVDAERRRADRAEESARNALQRKQVPLDAPLAVPHLKQVLNTGSKREGLG